MKRQFFKGYKIRRVDDTTEIYWGWSLSEISNLESLYYGNETFDVVSRVYEIENEFHRFELLEGSGTFRDINEACGDITEVETDIGIAGYLWNAAVEAYEDSAPAYYEIACDIFGGFAMWKAKAVQYIVVEFEADVRYLMEAAG